MLIEQLKDAAQHNKIRHIDHEFAQFVIDRLLGVPSNYASKALDVLTASAALVSEQTGKKHICIDLDELAQQPLTLGEERFDFCFPSRVQWIKTLSQFSVVNLISVEQPALLDCNPPLVLETSKHSSRLYLNRYHYYEQHIADSLNARAKVIPVADEALLNKMAAVLFNKEDVSTDDKPTADNIDWQLVSAINAITNQLAVITGGPGTGKTTTVTKLLTLLLTQIPHPHQFQIRLAAPTGKAAGRLTESIRGAKIKLSSELADNTRLDPAHRTVLQNCLQLLPEQASTLHRLLKYIPNSTRFRHNKANPLALDLLVIDEVSMIDMPTLSKLLDALPTQARVIMLGDKDQLSSVEAGSIMGDICSVLEKISHENGGDTWLPYTTEHQQILRQVSGFSISEFCRSFNKPLSHCVSQLRKSYRFKGQIKALATACNNMQSQQVIDILNNNRLNQSNAVYYFPTPDSEQALASYTQQLINHCVQSYTPYINSLKKIQADGTNNENILNALKSFDQFRILCALRQGPLGTHNLNAQIGEKIRTLLKHHHAGEFYLGRPVMVTENNYSVNLFNGDIGITLPAIETPETMLVYFLTPDNQIRPVLPSRLPNHDCAYAMTIHKSQGSEFEQVTMVLPESISANAREVVSKELLYTGITRAKEKITLAGREEIIAQAVSRKVYRRSALAEKLWGF